MNSILSTLPILLKITKGPPLKRWQSLCAAIKHPLGRAPVACQLLTLQSENWRWAMPHLVLPHEWCFCWSLNLGPFVDRQTFWFSLSCTHFLAFSSPLLSRGVISHMVANRSDNDQDKTGTQEWSAWIWKGVNCEHVTSGAKGASFGLGATLQGAGGHWQCQDVETDEDLEESSVSEREVVGGLQSCSSCPWKQMQGIREKGGSEDMGVWCEACRLLTFCLVALIRRETRWRRERTWPEPTGPSDLPPLYSGQLD